MQPRVPVVFVNGLARSSYSLAFVAIAFPALRLTRQLTTQLLHPFETVRPGTDIFFHNMVGNKQHWLDQDVRRLRLHFLPNYPLGKLALIHCVPYDSIRLRDCTAKRRRFCEHAPTF